MESKAAPNVIYIRGHEPERELLTALQPFERKINNDHAKGRPVDYEVKVDGLSAIPRTNDPSEFAGVLDHIDFAGTRSIEIRLYQGHSWHHSRHLILIESKRGEGTLAGVEETLNQRFEAYRHSFEHKALLEAHEKLKEEYRDLEEYANLVDKELAEYRSKRLHFGNIDLVEVGGALLEGFVRRNPHIISGLPGGQALAGALGDGGTNRAYEVEASQEEPGVRRRQPSDTVTTANLAWERFDHGQSLQVLAIIEKLAQEPGKIPAVLAFLTSNR